MDQALNFVQDAIDKNFDKFEVGFPSRCRIWGKNPHIYTPAFSIPLLKKRQNSFFCVCRSNSPFSGGLAGIVKAYIALCPPLFLVYIFIHFILYLFGSCIVLLKYSEFLDTFRFPVIWYILSADDFLLI